MRINDPDFERICRIRWKLQKQEKNFNFKLHIFAVSTGLVFDTPKKVSRDHLWASQILFSKCYYSTIPTTKNAFVEFMNENRSGTSRTFFDINLIYPDDRGCKKPEHVIDHFVNLSRFAASQ